MLFRSHCLRMEPPGCFVAEEDVWLDDILRQEFRHHTVVNLGQAEVETVGVRHVLANTATGERVAHGTLAPTRQLHLTRVFAIPILRRA